jgi:P27 family predicted phage terminase small subunit
MRLKFDIPESYHPEAKKTMSEIIRQLQKKDGFEKQDFPALSILGYSYHNYFISRDILLKDGLMIQEQDQIRQPTLPGMEPLFITKLRASKPHPALKICNDSQNQITKILIEFGLTPKSRKKNLDMAEAPTPDNVSPIDKFLPKIETR